MFTELEKKQLLKLNKALSRDIKIGLADTGHPQSQMFQKFCDNLVQLVPKIKIAKEDGSPQQPPQILIGNGLRYQALPGGLEMPPFIEALTALDSEPIQIEVINAISTRNPALLGATSLESIIKDGQASHLAAMMLEAQEIFPAFYDLLVHDRWPVRLGAMVVIEEIAEKSPGKASEAIDPLWARFKGVSDQVKGDILYLFGEIGDRSAIPWLAEVTAGEFDAEVKEAAKEALEKLVTS